MVMDGFLERLPRAVLQDIVSCLDLSSFFAAATTCKALKAAADQELPFLQALDLEEYLFDYSMLERLLSSGIGSSSSQVSLKLRGVQCGGDLIGKLKLDELQLDYCTIGTDFFSRDSCANLRRLAMKPWHTPMCLSSLEDCRSLETLSVTFYPLVRNFAFIPPPSLRVLEIGGLLDGINLVKDFPVSHCNLQRLSLVLEVLSDSIIHHISENLPMLLELELQDQDQMPSELTNSGIQKLGALTRLRRLSLVRYGSPVMGVHDVGILTMIQSLQQLESIRLGTFGRITDASFAAILSGCPRLHTIEFTRTSLLTDLTFHNLSSLAPERFVNLNLCVNKLITADTLGRLTCCINLEIVNLRSCKSIGDAGLRDISKLCNLKTLLLDYSDVGDIGLYSLAKGRMRLASISLRACTRVTDDGIIALVSGPISKTLKSLDVSLIPTLTDAAVLSIVNNRVQLGELWLRNCYLIGNVSVMALATHSQGRVLKLLDIWCCRKITPDAVRWFKWPYFAGLRKLGVPDSLENSIASVRQFTRLTFDGSECNDSLGSKCLDAFERGVDPVPYTNRFPR